MTTILVVDDDEDTRFFITRMLAKAGYEVVTAGSGDDALELAADPDRPIDCLLTDVSLPGLDGPELVRQFTAHRPSVPVLYMTGYPPETIVDSGRVAPGSTVLGKPFTSSDLIAAVRTAGPAPG